MQPKGSTRVTKKKAAPTTEWHESQQAKGEKQAIISDQGVDGKEAEMFAKKEVPSAQ